MRSSDVSACTPVQACFSGVAGKSGSFQVGAACGHRQVDMFLPQLLHVCTSLDLREHLHTALPTYSHFSRHMLRASLCASNMFVRAYL